MFLPVLRDFDRSPHASRRCELRVECFHTRFEGRAEFKALWTPRSRSRLRAPQRALQLFWHHLHLHAAARLAEGEETTAQQELSKRVRSQAAPRRCDLQLGCRFQPRRARTFFEPVLASSDMDV